MTKQIALLSLDSGESVAIRAAELSDAPGLIDHVHRVAAESDFLATTPGEFEMSIEQQESYIRRMSETANALCLVAEAGGEIVGVLTFNAGRRERVRHIGELGISVFRDYWGQGIGQSLMTALIDWAPSAGVTKLTLRVRSDNERAIDLYKRLGFVVEGTQSRGLRVNGCYYTLLLMGLEL